MKAPGGLGDEGEHRPRDRPLDVETAILGVGLEVSSYAGIVVAILLRPPKSGGERLVCSVKTHGGCDN